MSERVIGFLHFFSRSDPKIKAFNAYLDNVDLGEHGKRVWVERYGRTARARILWSTNGRKCLEKSEYFELSADGKIIRNFEGFFETDRSGW